MNSIFEKLVINTVLKDRRKDHPLGKDFSSYELSKGYMQLKTITARKFKDALLIILGITVASFGLEGFLLPNRFIDGGATGMALLTSEISGISISILLVAINIPFMFLGYLVIGKEFAFKTVLAIVGLGVVCISCTFSCSNAG